MKLPWDAQMKPAALHMQDRERSADPYHSYRWTKLSRAWRQEHPICECCKSQGRVKSAEVVDHIVPWPVCGTQGFFDRGNLQSLCAQCNIDKGNKDKKLIQQWKLSNQGKTAGRK